jgi:hypothetical protein
MKWILLAASVTVFGEDWDAVRNVFPAQEAIVKPLDGKRLKGSIKLVSDTAVEIETKSGLISVERRLVDWVSVKKGERKAGARTGALIGTTFAVFLGIISGDAKGAAAAAPIMAGVYVLVGLGARRHFVIYRQFKPVGDWR